MRYNVFLNSDPDIKESRLKKAKELGAHNTLMVDDTDPQTLAMKVAEVMGCMPGVTLECCGVQASISLGMHVSY